MTDMTAEPRKVSFKTRIIDLAKGPHALPALTVISFAESSFFPLPPDLLLIPMAATAPRKWWIYALVCTVASVLGGLLGYAIGFYLFETVGRAILDFFGYGGKEAEFQAMYAKYGIWVIFLKGLTPIPFKLVTIVSGAMHYSLPVFVAACAVTRGLRFGVFAFLASKFGPQIVPVIEKRMGIVAAVVIVLIIGVIVAMKYLNLH